MKLDPDKFSFSSSRKRKSGVQPKQIKAGKTVVAHSSKGRVEKRVVVKPKTSNSVQKKPKLSHKTPKTGKTKTQSTQKKSLSEQSQKKSEARKQSNKIKTKNERIGIKQPEKRKLQTVGKNTHSKQIKVKPKQNKPQSRNKKSPFKGLIVKMSFNFVKKKTSAPHAR